MRDCRSKLLYTLLVIILLVNTPSFAAETDEYSLGKAIFKLVFYITITLLVLIVAVYGTKFIAKNTKKFVSSKYVQILDSLNLGTNLKIVVIEINKKIYILAITNNNVEVLDLIPKDDFETNVDFEEQLNRYRSINFKDYDYLDKIQSNIKKILIKSNKDIDKEDENNEKEH